MYIKEEEAEYHHAEEEHNDNEKRRLEAVNQMNNSAYDTMTSINGRLLTFINGPPTEPPYQPKGDQG